MQVSLRSQQVFSTFVRLPGSGCPNKTGERLRGRGLSSRNLSLSIFGEQSIYYLPGGSSRLNSETRLETKQTVTQMRVSPMLKARSPRGSPQDDMSETMVTHSQNHEKISQCMNLAKQGRDGCGKPRGSAKSQLTPPPKVASRNLGIELLPNPVDKASEMAH